METIIDILKNGNSKDEVSPVKFSLEVEHLALESKLTFLESIQLLVNEHDIDEMKVSKYITNNLKEKIALENNIISFIPTGVLPL